VIPKITDFGLAKRIDEEQARTRTGDVLGTPAYMAPEQAAGKSKEIGPACDIYALGALLYEMLTGRPPFEGPSAWDTVSLVLTAEPEPPSRRNRQVPRDLETICLKCLQKEPARRYASALALADDLRRFQASEPIEARPVGPLERAGKWARRYPGWATLAAVLAAGVAVGLPGVTALWLRAERARSEATDNEKKAQEQKGLADEARDKADKLRKEAEHREARLALERGHELCRRGPLPKGLLWLARSLELAERAGDGDLERAVRINLADWRRQLGKAEWVLATPDGFHTATPSPDGKKAIVAAGMITRELDVASGDAPARWSGPPMMTLSLRHGGDNMRDGRCVAYSRDGKVVLLARSNGAALLWDVAKRRPIRRIEHGPEDIWAVDVSRDDKTFLTAGTKVNSVRFWDRAGQPVGQPLLHPARVWGAAFSPRDDLVVTGCEDRLARFWDWRKGVVCGPPLPHQDQVTVVTFSPDGKTVLTGCRDGTVQLWDVTTRQPIGPAVFHLSDINALAFRPDGRAFLTGSRDRSARLWHTLTRQPLATFQHEGSVTAVAFSPDGRRCLTGGRDDTVRLWRLPEELSLGAPLAHNQAVFAVALSPDDRLLLTASKSEARLWSVPQRKPLANWGGNGPALNVIRAAALAPDGRTIALGRWAYGASLHGFMGPGRLDLLGPPPGKPFEQDDGVLLLAFGRSAKQLLTRRGPASRPGSSQPAGGRVELWERHEGALQLRSTFEHPADVGCLAVGPGGELVSACENRTVYVWNMEGKQVAALVQPDAVHAVALSGEGRALLAGCADGTARLWDVKTGRLRAALHHQGDVLAVAFSPDGRTALTGSADQTVRLWDVATAAPLGPPRWHAGAVQAVAFSHRGDTIVSGSHDRTAQFWRGTTRPLSGDREAIKAWAELLAGAELGPEGAESALGAAELARRREVAGALLR
jgi:WD40 repeat protein